MESTQATNWAQKRYLRWLDQVLPPQGKVTLNRRNVFILPTRNGLLFVFAALLIFIAAINYAVSLAFAVAFLMVSLFILAILHGFNNLNQLSLSADSSPPVFCGQDATFNVLLSRNDSKFHESLELQFGDGQISQADLVSQDQFQAQVYIKAQKRGRFKAPRLRITSRFPLGLCRAWSVVDLDMYCLVYPKPISISLADLDQGNKGQDEAAIILQGSEDFYGLRQYQPGDSPRQMAWKNLAQGRGLHTKTYIDYADDKRWLDWEAFNGFNTEERLSRLCYCVLMLAKSSNTYGLRIPGSRVDPATGLKHRNAVLEILAHYQDSAADDSTNE